MRSYSGLVALLPLLVASGAMAEEVIFAVRQPKGPHWYENFGHTVTDVNRILAGKSLRLPTEGYFAKAIAVDRSRNFYVTGSTNLFGGKDLDMLTIVPAGNDGRAGPGYGSIAGPGGAIDAVTVGAADGRRAAPTVRVHVRAGLRVLYEDDVPAR